METPKTRKHVGIRLATGLVTLLVWGQNLALLAMYGLDFWIGTVASMFGMMDREGVEPLILVSKPHIALLSPST